VEWKISCEFLLRNFLLFEHTTTKEQKKETTFLFVWFVGNLQQRPVFARAHVDLFSKHKPFS
jgi:hypothetical protein